MPAAEGSEHPWFEQGHCQQPVGRVDEGLEHDVGREGVTDHIGSLDAEVIEYGDHVSSLIAQSVPLLCR